MNFEWDENKRRLNLEKHAIDFVDAARMLARAPLIMEDDRHDYGETRYLAFGPLDEVLMVVIFTIHDDVFRIISARRANARERRNYESRPQTRPDEYDS